MGWLIRGGNAGNTGKEDCEPGAVGGSISCGGDFDLTTVPADYFPCDPEAQACADVSLGGEEGLEDSLCKFVWDARTVVFDYETCPLVYASIQVVDNG